MSINEIRLEAQDLNQQAAVLISVGSFDAARNKIENAIEIDPMLMDSYKNYGDLSMAIEKYDDAKNFYKKSILIEKMGLLYFLYGNACFMKDEVHEGLEYYNLAISNGYDNDEMLFFMGMAYEHLNDDHMALRYFQKACIKNPSRSDYLVKKISILIKLGLYDNAEESVEELIQNSPELYDGYHIKTQLLLYKENINEAIVFSKMASDRFPEDPDLMYDYLKAIALSKDFVLAYKLLDVAKQMKYYEDSKSKFLMLEAQVSAEDGDVEKAMNCCQSCIDLEGESFFDGEARFMLMNLNLVQSNYERALIIAEELILKDTGDLYYHAALYYRPFCLKQLDQMDKALVYYKEANSIYRLETLKNPSAVDIYLYRVMCLKDIGEFEKALELLDFISGISDKIAEVHTLRADIYRSLGKNSKADIEMNYAYEIKPELKPAIEKVGD